MKQFVWRQYKAHIRQLQVIWHDLKHSRCTFFLLFFSCTHDWCDGDSSRYCSKSQLIVYILLPFIVEEFTRLCAANATWSSTGVTVASLTAPRDIYVFKNGTVLVADSYNNRVMKWDLNAYVGVLVAGTGSYGSWRNLLARPISLTSKSRKTLWNTISFFVLFSPRWTSVRLWYRKLSNTGSIFSQSNCMKWYFSTCRYFLSIQMSVHQMQQQLSDVTVKV